MIQAILNRRSIRKYKSENVPSEAIKEILKAGILYERKERAAKVVGGGAAGDSPLKCVSISKFSPKAKIWLRPCCGAVIVKGTFLTDRAVQANWENKHNHTLHKPMGATNVTNE